MPNYDGDTLTITLDSGVTEIDVQDDIYEPWKDWMLESTVNRKYPAAFRSDGGSPLSSIINQGSYFFLNNTAGWRIKPPEEDITIYLTGNLAVEDTTLPAFISTLGTYTASILGLQPVTQGVTPVMKEQLEYSSFNGGVSYDATSPYTGIIWPVGTPQEPVNNTYDAADIAVARGFTLDFILSDLTMPTDLPLSGFTFLGSGKDRTLITVPDLATVSECTYIDAEITGYLDGNNTIKDCLITNLSYVKGYIEGCVLAPGTSTLAGTEVAHFLDCYSGQPGVSTPIIDCGGSGQELAIRNYNGGIKLINKSGNEDVSIDLNSGQIILDNTVTGGTIVARGVGKLIDTSGDTIKSGTWNGVTILNETINPEHIANHTWDYQTTELTTSGSIGELISKKLLSLAMYLGLK